MTVYIASPFFNDEELKNVEYVENLLESRGIKYFSPMRYSDIPEKVGTTDWAYKLYNIDTNGLMCSDVVVALYYGNNSDSGTAFECGYAVANKKPVVLVHINNDDSNLMLHCGCTTNIVLDDLKDFDFDTMPIYEYTGKMF